MLPHLLHKLKLINICKRFSAQYVTQTKPTKIQRIIGVHVETL